MPQKQEIIRALASKNIRALASKKSSGPRGNKVQFAVNDKEYFVDFVPEEGRWFVFTPTMEGFYRVPVVHDDQLPVASPVVVIPEDEGPKTIN